MFLCILRLFLWILFSKLCGGWDLWTEEQSLFIFTNWAWWKVNLNPRPQGHTLKSQARLFSGASPSYLHIASLNSTKVTVTIFSSASLNEDRLIEKLKPSNKILQWALANVILVTLSTMIRERRECCYKKSSMIITLNIPFREEQKDMHKRSYAKPIFKSYVNIFYINN